MTKTQFIKKIKSMGTKREINEYLEKECLRLFECGGVEPSDYENNYLLPKIILYVALRNLAEQYRPLSEYKHEAENLLHF